MYDPTVFDNLKVALENQLYDLDTLDEQITIQNRRDIMDFAVLSREFALKFTLRDEPGVEAEVILRTTIKDLAGEIMDNPSIRPACTLALRFQKTVMQPETSCKAVEQAMVAIWEQGIELRQTISYLAGTQKPELLNTIDATFLPRLTEDNMRELPVFLQHMLETVHVLNRL